MVSFVLTTTISVLHFGTILCNLVSSKILAKLLALVIAHILLWNWSLAMLLDDFAIVIWTIVKKNNNYILLDSCGVEVFRRKENRRKELYQYCADNGIEVQEEF